MRICKNHTLQDFTESQIARDQGLKNVPDLVHIQNMKSLCGPIEFLENFTAVEISSGYRSPELNKMVGGSPRSSHTNGLGVDVKTSLPNFMTGYLLRLYDNNLYIEESWFGHVHFHKPNRYDAAEPSLSLFWLPAILIFMGIFIVMPRSFFSRIRGHSLRFLRGIKNNIAQM